MMVMVMVMMMEDVEMRNMKVKIEHHLLALTLFWTLFLVFFKTHQKEGIFFTEKPNKKHNDWFKTIDEEEEEYKTVV